MYCNHTCRSCSLFPSRLKNTILVPFLDGKLYICLGVQWFRFLNPEVRDEAEPCWVLGTESADAGSVTTTALYYIVLPRASSWVTRRLPRSRYIEGMQTVAVTTVGDSICYEHNVHVLSCWSSEISVMWMQIIWCLIGYLFIMMFR